MAPELWGLGGAFGAVILTKGFDVILAAFDRHRSKVEAEARLISDREQAERRETLQRISHLEAQMGDMSVGQEATHAALEQLSIQVQQLDRRRNV